MTKLKTIKANWPAPANVQAYTSTRLGGVSKAPFESLNLGYSSGDDRLAVSQNREQLNRSLQLPNPPSWHTQTHSNIARHATDPTEEADALYSNEAGVVCVVQTADCLPVLLCNQAGNEVAAIHAGWRGLANDIIANTLKLFQSPASQLLAWLGPAISQSCFEVGAEVKAAFLAQSPLAEQAFINHPDTPDKYFADLYSLAKLQLNKLGIQSVFGGNYCTYTQPELFFSYRRDGTTGRMASLIWLND